MSSFYFINAEAARILAYGAMDACGPLRIEPLESDGDCYRVRITHTVDDRVLKLAAQMAVQTGGVVAAIEEPPQ